MLLMSSVLQAAFFCLEEKVMSKKIRILFVICTLLIAIFSLSGCQSTDKKESYLSITNYTYDYNSQTDETKVVWTGLLSNDTIYDFNGFEIKFKLTYGDSTTKNKYYTYSRGVKRGDSYAGSFSFYCDGDLSKAEYVSWSADYVSFWDMYKAWIIVMICVAAIGTLIYIIVMIIEDLEFGDFIDILEDFDVGWVIFAVLPVIWSIFDLCFGLINWVNILIILGGVVAFILLVLIAHFIKFIADEGFVGDVAGDFVGDFVAGTVGVVGSVIESFKKKPNGSNDDNDGFDNNYEKISDYINDKDKLMLFRVEQLKEYCRDNGINGYSSINKSSGASNKTNIIKFDDIAGLEEAKSVFKEKVVYAFEYKDLYEKYGKKVGGGILLFGLPGTGKTMFAEAASNETDSLFIPIKCSDIKSKWYGESEANVKKVFEKARKAKKAIIFFDEFEAIGAKRSDDSDNVNNDLVPQILAEMQSVGAGNSNSIIMVIAATNRPWAIDSAFLRPGRFDEKIYIPLPDEPARKKIFELKLKTVPKEELDFDFLAMVTEGFNGPDIAEFCNKLKTLAINRTIKSGNESLITMEDARNVAKIAKSSVSLEDVELLENFMK